MPPAANTFTILQKGCTVMKPVIIALAAFLVLPAAAVTQQAQGLHSCADPDVETGVHIYRLLDGQSREIGTVTREWSDTTIGGRPVLRLRNTSAGRDGSFTIESTFLFDPREPAPIHALVRTGRGEPSTQLRQVDNRITGHGVGRGGQREPVSFESAEPVILPGSAAALVPLLDWERCRVVTASVLEPPRELRTVTFTRTEAELPFGGKVVPVYAVEVREPSGTTTVFVSRERPRIELHRETATARLVWLR